MTIGRKEHKKPTDVEQWCLPDIVYLYATYIDEADQMAEMEEDVKGAE